jgi:hypothetical protein
MEGYFNWALSSSYATLPAARAVAKEPVPEPVTSPVNVIVWSPVFVPETVAFDGAVSVAPSAIVSVAEVAGAVTATLLTEVAVATPRAGVTSVGDVSTTNFVPVPVCEAIEVALPTDVIGPVRFALVVTVAALPLMLPVAEPIFGVVKTGEFANTKAPVPVSSEITPANCAEVVAANWPRVPVVTAVFATSPVFVPDTAVVPVTARVGVADPESTTAFTEVGVIAPSVSEIAGVVVDVATDPDTPFAVVTDTSVTVPVPVGATNSRAVSPAFTRGTFNAAPVYDAGTSVRPMNVPPPPPPGIVSVTDVPRTEPVTPAPVKSIDDTFGTRVTPSSFIVTGLPIS